MAWELPEKELFNFLRKKVLSTVSHAAERPNKTQTEQCHLDVAMRELLVLWQE